MLFSPPRMYAVLCALQILANGLLRGRVRSNTDLLEAPLAAELEKVGCPACASSCLCVKLVQRLCTFGDCPDRLDTLALPKQCEMREHQNPSCKFCKQPFAACTVAATFSRTSRRDSTRQRFCGACSIRRVRFRVWGRVG